MNHPAQSILVNNNSNHIVNDKPSFGIDKSLKIERKESTTSVSVNDIQRGISQYLQRSFKTI